MTTAAQEIALHILASALVARERIHAAEGMATVLRVSFLKSSKSWSSCDFSGWSWPSAAIY